MNFHGNMWASVAACGNRWQHVATCDKLWQHVATCGHKNQHLTNTGDLRSFCENPVPSPHTLVKCGGARRQTGEVGGGDEGSEGRRAREGVRGNYSHFAPIRTYSTIKVRVEACKPDSHRFSPASRRGRGKRGFHRRATNPHRLATCCVRFRGALAARCLHVSPHVAACCQYSGKAKRP
jgi:hypothetical protein